MADQKLTALTAEATPVSTDLTYLVDDPGGTPISKKVTLANAITKAHGLADGIVKVDTGVMTPATAGTDYVETETDPVVGAVTGIVKADGAGNISAATDGTDYLASVNIDATLTGAGTTASALGIDLTNANTWTGVQNFTNGIDIAGSTITRTEFTGDDIGIVTGTEGRADEVSMWNADGDLVSTDKELSDFYVSGGTDVAIADGGTGASTQQAALDNITAASGGSANQVLTTDGTNASWQDATGGGGTDVWNEISSANYTATPTDTNTLAMSDTTGLYVGQAIRYTISSVVYYGQIIALTTDTSIDVRGASLSGDVTKLEYSIIPVQEKEYVVNGAWADAVNVAILENDVLGQSRWTNGAAYCIGFDAVVQTDDSSVNQPRINVRIGSTAADYISTSNSNAGIDASETWASTGVDIATSKYAVSYQDVIELKTDANGSNNDSTDLTVKILFVIV